MKKSRLALLTALLCFISMMMAGPQAFASDTAEEAAKETWGTMQRIDGDGYLYYMDYTGDLSV